MVLYNHENDLQMIDEPSGSQFNINKDYIGFRTITTLGELEALEIFSSIIDSQDREDMNSELLVLIPTFAGTLITAEMQLVHTNGVQSLGRGVGVVTGSAGVGIDGSGNLVFTPDITYFFTANVPATAVLVKVRTNIVANNCSEDFNPNANGIVAYMVQSYKNAPNGATSGQDATIFIGKTAGAYDDVDQSTSAIAGSSSGVNIGDAGTFYGECLIDNFGGVGNQCGTGGTYGNYYITFGMQISAPVASKTYKFVFELQYI